MVVELRKNLEIARTLETETGGLRLWHTGPISQSDDARSEQFGPVGQLSGLLRAFAARFRGLCETHIETARNEFSRWPVEDDTIFARLRIWAAADPDLVSDDSFDAVLSSLSDSAFWDVGHQRDLLHTIRSRWTALSAAARRQIQMRLLSGRPRRDGEEDAEFARRRARLTLDRLTWMSRHGCDLGAHMDGELSQLRVLAPDWDPDHAEHAAESLEGEGGIVATRTEYSALLSESLTTTLSRARELAGRRTDFLVEQDPYRGLSEGRPVRAFAALGTAAKRGEYPDWAWTTFLTADARKSDRPRLKALIAERLARCPPEAVSTFLSAASRWLTNGGEGLAEEYPNSFRAVMGTLVGILRQYPDTAGSDLLNPTSAQLDDGSHKLTNGNAGRSRVLWP